MRWLAVFGETLSMIFNPRPDRRFRDEIRIDSSGAIEEQSITDPTPSKWALKKCEGPLLALRGSRANSRVSVVSRRRRCRG